MKVENKNIWKKTMKYIITFLILIICYISSLTLVSTIDSKYMKVNVQKSANILLEQMDSESDYRLFFYIPYRMQKIEFDNPSDALMINTAYSIDNKTPFKSAMLARKNYVEGLTTKENGDTTGRLKSSDKYGVFYQPIKELYNIANDYSDESFEYVRYWHGYLTVLRLLLLIFDINMIRYFLIIVTLILEIYVLKLIYDKLGFKICTAFFIGFLLTEAFFIGISLQGTPIFIIMLVSSIIILKTEKMTMMQLFIIGSLTNFFDFLTVPVITLGVPLILYFLIEQKHSNIYTIKKSIRLIIISGIIWILGYSLTWLAKWFIVGVFCNRNVLEIVNNQIRFRIIENNLTYLDEFKMLLNYTFRGTFVSIGIYVFIMIYMIKFLHNSKNITNINEVMEKKVKIVFPFFIISLIPLLWAIVLKNHTTHHTFFTYRMMMISIISIGVMFSKLSLKEKV